MMTEFREKYQRRSAEDEHSIMQLYKDYGVNPAAGYPHIAAAADPVRAWMVFRSSIEFRQASFVGWITDLSIPDVIATLPFRIPLIGMDR